eukprot:1210910-Amphidinium_carterae.1
MEHDSVHVFKKSHSGTDLVGETPSQMTRQHAIVPILSVVHPPKPQEQKTTLVLHTPSLTLNYHPIAIHYRINSPNPKTGNNYRN